MAINIKSFEFNMFGINTYVVWDQATRHTMIIDPGMISPQEQQLLSDYIDLNHLKVTDLVNTHLHLDHTFGNEYVKKRYNVDLQAHSADALLGLHRAQQAARFGIRASLPPVTIDRLLSDGDTITLGKTVFTVLNVPGHSPGSIVLYDKTDKCLFAGDVLFRGSIGRTDLDMGNHIQLIDSLHNKLLTLPDDTVVYPGHGPATTIGNERISNPYL